MAHHKAALKTIRQTKKRKERNRNAKSRVRTSVKLVASAIESGDKEKAQAALRSAESVLAVTAGKGILPKRRVARKTSRLAKQVASLG